MMKIVTILEAIKVEEKKGFLFLILITPNIKADMVKSEIDRYLINF
ncbi:hypothetical protein [Bacillus thuringiensis]